MKTPLQEQRTAFGKYELLHRLAVGGMAEIFLARSASSGFTRHCVIKRILPEYSSDRRFISMFIDEARITIGLDHPNIVRLFDFGQVDGVYFMAMEYVDGVDLVDLLRQQHKRGTILPFEVAAFVAQQMCFGLHHAHTQTDYQGNPQAIVHRDVSPHNVFLSWKGDVKVGDFGIASASNKISHTQTGTVKGKFAYMSPEHATTGVVDHRADIWAVGVVLHEMLTGRRLFASENPVTTIARVCEQPIPSPRERNESTPEALEHIVMRALNRDIDQRYQSAQEIARELAQYTTSVGFDQPRFALFLSELNFDEPTTRPGFHMPGPSQVEHEKLSAHSSGDAQIQRLFEDLQKRPDLWRLVEIGKRHLRLHNHPEALRALRTAAGVFASRGLLVQAICAHAPARDILDDDGLRADLRAIAKLHRGGRNELERYIAAIDARDYWDILNQVDSDGLGHDGEDTVLRRPAPLLGRLPPDEFVRLVERVQVKTHEVGTTIIREGDRGNSLFACGRGRLVVHTQPAGPGDGSVTLPPGGEKSLQDVMQRLNVTTDRIYLSALADGDFFGEFSFLTARPRSASVETITDCVIMEIDQKTAEEVLLRDPAYKEPLLEFYKERVGELMLAKNPVFAILSPQDRRQLLSKARVRRYRDQQVVVEEGEVTGDIYFIKHGEVEVYKEDDGLPIFINKLREGDFFGEMAALQGTPRSASVRAMGDVELFCLQKGDLEDILSRERQARELIEAAITLRAAEKQARVAESRRIFEGV